jgi:hypothetical protein
MMMLRLTSRPAAAEITIRNGKKHIRRSAASIRELLMKSTALSRVQNVPAALAFTRAAVAVALWCSVADDRCGGCP